MTAGTFTLLVLALYVLLLQRLNRRNFIVSPVGIHIAYLAMYVVVPAVLLYNSGLSHEEGSYGIVIQERCLEILDLAIISMGIGAGLAGAKYRFSTRSFERLKRLRDDLSGPVQRARVKLTLIFASVITAIFFYTNREFLSFLSSPAALLRHYFFIQTFKTDIEFGANYLLQGVHQLFPIMSVVFLAKWYMSHKPLYRNLAILIICIDVVCLSLYGAVWVAFSGVVMLLLMRQYFRPLTRKDLVWVAPGLVIMIVGSVAYKHGYVSVEGLDYDAFQSIAGDVLGSRFSSGAAQLQFVIQMFPTHLPHMFGLGFLHDLIAMIPSPIKRSIFPETYWVGFDGYMYYLMFGAYGGSAQIPVMGEFYCEFGSLGVIVGSIAYGYFIQRLSNLFAARRFKSLTGVAFGVILGYRFAEATVEGLGGRLMVSAAWIVILYFFFSPTKATSPIRQECAGGALPLNPPKIDGL